METDNLGVCNDNIASEELHQTDSGSETVDPERFDSETVFNSDIAQRQAIERRYRNTSDRNRRSQQICKFFFGAPADDILDRRH